MAALGSGLSSESAVLTYTHAYPDFHDKIRELTEAISAAGVRIRDSGHAVVDAVGHEPAEVVAHGSIVVTRSRGK